MPALSDERRAADFLNTSHPTEEKAIGPVRPADECPWRRPFPEAFDQCSVFVPQAFQAHDIQYRPLAPVLTCRHLVSRPFPLPKAGWYGACELGDAAARRAQLERRIVTAVKPGS
jgi:hypothetical protein